VLVEAAKGTACTSWKSFWLSYVFCATEELALHMASF